MPTLTIDIALFSVFLAVNLIVGLKYRGKTQTFKEYAIGDKKFSTATLTATIVATWMLGSALFIDIENTYSQGLYYTTALIIGVIGGLLIAGRVIGPRMGKFLNNVSVPEALGGLYGKGVQAIVGISGVLSNIGYIAIQFKVISKILTILFNYEGPWVTTISATIIILYSAYGGVKAVTFTDVIQFITFGMLLPVLALVIWNHLEDPSQVVQMLNHNPLFSFKEVVRWTPEFMGTLILICYFITPDFPPQLFQRMAMARDTIQVKRSLTYAAIVCLAVELCMIWIGILLLVDQPGLEPSQVVQYMVNQYTYPGLKGFLGIGVIALAMSTADSALNSCAVLIANDILPPLQPKQQSSLKVARWATFGLGGLALLVALRELNLLDLILLSASFQAPIVAIPMILAVFGFQTSRRVVFMAMGAGFTTVVACLAYFKSVNGFFPGMIANFIVLLSAHYLLGEKGGWGNNPVEREPAPLLQHTTWKERLAAARQFKLYPYLERVLPQQEHACLLLGFYIFTTTYALLYLLPQEVALEYPGLYRGVQYSVALIITSFLGFPVWPKSLKNNRFMVWIWPISIFYAFFVVGGVLVIMSSFSLPQMLLLTLNFVMALLLLHWPLALGMAISGIFVAILFFKQYTGLEILPGDLGSIQCITIISARILPAPKALYMGTMSRNGFWLPKSREALALFDNQRIVDAHYGVTEFTKGEEGLTQTYVIPVRLREVRPEMMDIPQMEIGRLGEGPKEVLLEETALLTRLQEETSIDLTLAEKAIKTIKKYHGYVKRKSGEPFYLHPIAATEILLDYTQDQAAVLATLLHDAVEDTPLTLPEIGVIFGPDVAAIVNKVTHLDGHLHQINMAPHENIQQLLEETDIRVLQVKLADRTHNMRTIEGHPSLAKQKQIADETLHFFVSIAKYLGLKQIEEELQEIIVSVLKKR